MKMRKFAGLMLASALMLSMAGCSAVSIDGEEGSTSASASAEGSGAIGF